MSLKQNNLDFLQYQATKNSIVWKILSGFLSLSRGLKRLLLRNSGKEEMVLDPASENFDVDFSKDDDRELMPQAWLSYPELRKIWFSESKHLVGRKIILVSSDAFIAGQGYGGYTTSLLLGGYLASKEKASLEIWNLIDDSSVSKIGNFIKENLAIDLKNITMKNVNSESPFFGPTDIFLATSWWSKRSLLLSGVDSSRIIYLVQEDETMFYPSSDKSLEASKELLTSKHIIFNTQLLKNHLESRHPELKNIHSSVFEPPFAQVQSRVPSPTNAEKKRLVFYARPNHPRNLFMLGIQVLESLVDQLDSHRWEVIFLGTGLPDSITINSHWEATVLQDITYPQYKSLLSSTDVVLSLMLAPHPSYPPLEAAMAGAWVVTNSYQNRIDLNQYNDQIVVTLPDLFALESAVWKCIQNVEIGSYPAAPNHSIMPNNWNDSFKSLMDYSVETQ